MAICTLHIVRSCLSFMVISLPLLSFLCKALPFSGLSWFYGPFRILDGGADTGFNKVTPEKYTARLFHFCGTRKLVEVKQVGIMGEAKRLRGILDDSKIGNMGNVQKGIMGDSKIGIMINAKKGIMCDSKIGLMVNAKKGIMGDSKIGLMVNAKKGIISDSKIHVGLMVIMER